MDPLKNLPEEVTEQIFVLLPVKDLLSCCLVCPNWKNAVNKNVIWKQHCNPNLDLDDMKCIVSPVFEVPEINSESLAPICDYRLKFMREVHLCNNFRSNRCVEYKISRSTVDKSEVINKYLFLNDSYKNVFHVWDIEGKPFEVQSVPHLLQQTPSHFQAVGNCLLVVQCNLLQVYFIDKGTVSLKLCRIFDKEEHFSDNIPDIDQIPMWYSDNIGLYPCDFTSLNEIVGSYFIGIIEQSHGNNSVMHIWDLSVGKKLKEDIIPGADETVENMCTGKNSKCLFIVLYLNSRKRNFGGVRCKIFCYDLNKLEFTQFYVESDHSIPFMLFEEKVVLLPCDQWEKSGSYTFVDAVTGKKITEKEFDNPINPKALDSNTVVLVFGSSNTVTVVDLLTQEVLMTFSVDFEVIEVHLLTNNILLVGGVDYHFVLEVWDIKRCCKLYSLDERSIMLCGRTLPRLCLQGMYSVHVLHFW